MARSGYFYTNGYDGRCLLFEWAISSQSVANNQTVIYWKLSGAGNASVQWYEAGNFKVAINGYTQYQSASRIKLYNGTVVADGYATINHDAYGNASFYAYAEAGIYTYAVNVSGQGSWNIDSIPRYPSISQSNSAKTETTATMKWTSDSVCDYLWYSINNGSSWTAVGAVNGKSGTYTISGLSANTKYNIKTRVRRKDSQLSKDSTALAVTTYAYPYANSMPNFTIGQLLTIGIFNPLGRNITVSLIGNDNSTIWTGTTTGTSIAGFIVESLQDALYKSIPNSKSGTYKVKVTYGSQVSTKTGGTYSVGANSALPSIEDVAYKDINAVSLALTENDQDIVQNQSQVRYTATGLTAQKYATVKACSVTVNNNTYNLSVSGTSASGGSAVIDSGTDVDAVFTVTDSRGFTASKTIKIHMLAWTVPSAIITLLRQDNFYSTCDLTVDALFASINGNNQIAITYEATKEGDTEPSVSGSVPDNVTSHVVLDNNFAWDVKIQLVDSFGGTTTYNVHISRGMPIIYFDRLKSSVSVNSFPANEKSFEVDGGFYLNGETIADVIVEQGTSGGWNYRKYASGDVECWRQYEINSTSITWNAYLSTGLNYGNFRVSYPFNITDAVITATLNYCGGNVGWISTANAYDNTQTSLTVVRNGNSGTLTVNINVKGKWR